MIKVGDMVRLVFACCTNGRKNIGWIGVVLDIGFVIPEDPCVCFCGLPTRGIHAQVDIGGIGWIPISWLVKIDPTSEHESVSERDEITA